MTVIPPESVPPQDQPVPSPGATQTGRSAPPTMVQSPQTVLRARPTGLTVMAILNFIFGGLGIIALFFLMLAQHWLYELTSGAALTWANYLMYFTRTVNIFLAVSSAVGYLRLRWFLGYVLGNAYASLAILNMLLYAVLLDEFGIMSFFWLIWPLLTLFLLNLVFRKEFTGGSPSRPSARTWVVLSAGVVVLAVLVVGAGMLARPGTTELTDVETVVGNRLGSDKSDPLAKEYARNISFPKVKINRSSPKELRLDFVVRNNNDRKVTRLDVEIALLDENGVQLAGRTDLFAHDSIFGENNTPIPAKGSKYAGCELQNPRQWKKGRVVVTITDIAMQPPSNPDPPGGDRRR